MAKAEQWRPIPGSDGWYECSDLGNFRSWKNGNGSARLQEPRPMKVRFPKNSGACISLRRCGEQSMYSVCRLVYLTWIGEVPKGMIVVRKDGNLENNRADNLVAIPHSQSFTPTVKKKIGKPRRKPVIKFDQALNIVDIYPSIKAAAQANYYNWKHFSNRITFRSRHIRSSVIFADGFIYSLDDDESVRKTLTLAMKELDSRGCRYNDPFTEKYYDVSEPAAPPESEEPGPGELEAADFEEVEVTGDLAPPGDELEEWRDVPGYEGWYQASSLGRVRSLMRRIPNKSPGIWVKRETPLLLKLTSQRGALVVSLRGPCSSNKQVVKVGTIVYQTFIGPIPSGGRVLHHWAQDDNRPENLFVSVPPKKRNERR